MCRQTRPLGNQICLLKDTPKKKIGEPIEGSKGKDLPGREKRITSVRSEKRELRGKKEKKRTFPAGATSEMDEAFRADAVSSIKILSREHGTPWKGGERKLWGNGGNPRKRRPQERSAIVSA